MRKLILSILVVFLTMLWVGEPPHTSHGQVSLAPTVISNQPPKKPDSNERIELEKTDSIFRKKASLLNNKIEEAQKNRQEIDQIHLKAVKEIKKQYRKEGRHIHTKEGDSVVLIHVETDTVFFPDTVLVPEPFLALKGKTYFGRWWRAQVKLIKQCTLGKNSKQYFRTIKGKIVKNKSHESTNPSGDTGNREKVPR